MPTVEINGSRINYCQVDCKSGNDCEDLVMIHGLATSLAFWYFSHAAEFSKRYRVTLYDMRGHGRSGITESGYTSNNMAVDLQKLIDHLKIDRAHFIAHSFGGVVALNLACIDPDRIASLMLIDTHIFAVRRLPKTKKWKSADSIQQILDKNGLDIDVKEPYFGYRLLSTVARMQTQNIEISEELKNMVNHLMWKNNKRTASRWLKLMETTKAEEELMGDDGLSLNSLRKLKFPILALYGEFSPAMPTGEQLLEVWSHADFRRIRKAGHFFPITRPFEFMKNCQQFWDGALIKELPRREGDYNKRHFRSERFFKEDDKWYFYTRESKKIGPFDDIEKAREFLRSEFISDMIIEKPVK
ncbi:MAG TPA: alpha/beta hydrolase [Nitrospirae bacterium]|nr:alpha/beta hydrolase [Gammaproteobacteria bacterium]HDK17612.1 alpha/beta hydrolase [Nitrospirota bacterium]HDZ62703.1 alpha/beta hydrolase [Nitrospirota bacterium]